MVFFNYALRKLNAKIVYYGPGLCGKTTNLQWIHDHFEGGQRGKMLSLATEGDRTIFFDLLPIDIGSIRGMQVTLQLYTVPGQVHYNSTRQLVLRGADGVVFVADSQRTMASSNVESLNNLEENLMLQGVELAKFPHVVQFNKRDLRDIMSVEDLDDALNQHTVPIFEAVAIEGIGVQETLEGIVKLVMRSLRERYEPVQGPQSPEAPSAAAGPWPVAAPRPAGAPMPPQPPSAPPSVSPAPPVPPAPPRPLGVDVRAETQEVGRPAAAAGAEVDEEVGEFLLRTDQGDDLDTQQDDVPTAVIAPPNQEPEPSTADELGIADEVVVDVDNEITETSMPVFEQPDDLFVTAAEPAVSASEPASAAAMEIEPEPEEVQPPELDEFEPPALEVGDQDSDPFSGAQPEPFAPEAAEPEVVEDEAPVPTPFDESPAAPELPDLGAGLEAVAEEPASAVVEDAADGADEFGEAVSALHDVAPEIVEEDEEPSEASLPEAEPFAAASPEADELSLDRIRAPGPFARQLDEATVVGAPDAPFGDDSVWQEPAPEPADEPLVPPSDALAEAEELDEVEPEPIEPFAAAPAPAEAEVEEAGPVEEPLPEPSFAEPALELAEEPVPEPAKEAPPEPAVEPPPAPSLAEPPMEAPAAVDEAVSRDREARRAGRAVDDLVASVLDAAPEPEAPVPADAIGAGEGSEPFLVGDGDPFADVEPAAPAPGGDEPQPIAARAVLVSPDDATGATANPLQTRQDTQLRVQLHSGSGAIADYGEVREMDIVVPVPGPWIGNRRVTMQLRLTFIPAAEDEDDGANGPA
jgi:signal recognition particle receptor subunit beta